MSEGITVFVSGLLGVAFAMALLYISVRITAKVTDFMEKSKEKNNA
ncbi:MAG: hypothetical protein R6V41_10725 [Desulfobacteraceae bacterium]